MEPAAAVRVEYTLTPEELREWWSLVAVRPAARDLRVRTYAVLMLTFGVCLLSQMASYGRPTEPRDVLGPAVAAIVLAGTFHVAIGARLRKQLRPDWPSGHELRQPRVMTFDAAGVSLSSPKVSTRIVWFAFDRWQETARLFLLRQQPGNLYYIVAKRAVPAGQDEAMRSLLRTNIVPLANRFPVAPALAPAPTVATPAPPPLATNAAVDRAAEAPGASVASADSA